MYVVKSASAQNHSIGNGYMGYHPYGSDYIGLLWHVIRPLDSLEKSFVGVACEELLNEGDIKIEKEEGFENPTRFTLTNDAILKYFPCKDKFNIMEDAENPIE